MSPSRCHHPGVLAFLRQIHQRSAFVVVGDAVQGEQVGDVTFLEADPAELHPADLGLGGADLPTGSLAADPLRLSQPAQVSAEQHPQNGRPTGRPALRQSRRHVLTPSCQLGPTRTAVVLSTSMLRLEAGKEEPKPELRCRESSRAIAPLLRDEVVEVAGFRAADEGDHLVGEYKRGPARAGRVSS